jgi:hypothetical protein
MLFNLQFLDVEIGHQRGPEEHERQQPVDGYQVRRAADSLGHHHEDTYGRHDGEHNNNVSNGAMEPRRPRTNGRDEL